MRFGFRPRSRSRTEFVDVFIHEGRAYIPVSGKTRDELFWYEGSFEECDLEESQLLQALQHACAKGNPRISQPSQRDYEKRQPFQAAMGMRSCGEMARRGVLRAGIWWFQDHLEVVFSPRGAKDIEEHDPKTIKRLPADTPLIDLVRHVLAEWDSRQRDAASETPRSVNS